MEFTTEGKGSTDSDIEEAFRDNAEDQVSTCENGIINFSKLNWAMIIKGIIQLFLAV